MNYQSGSRELCPQCEGRTIFDGRVFRKGKKRQRFQCMECGYQFVPIPISEVNAP